MTYNKRYVVAAVVAKALMGATLVWGLGTPPVASANGESVELRHPVVQTGEADYMSDGSRFLSDDLGNDSHEVIDPVTHQWRPVEEDDQEWSCVDDGNHVCGPNNTEGKPAACYDDGGVIVALWPCKAVEN